jgi:hypothetical protein
LLFRHDIGEVVLVRLWGGGELDCFVWRDIWTISQISFILIPSISLLQPLPPDKAIELTTPPKYLFPLHPGVPLTSTVKVGYDFDPVRFRHS